MSIAPSQCTSFIQVWVDVNALQQGATSGIYVVCDNSAKSTGEGTPELSTQVTTGSNVCWAVLPIDPQYNGYFTLNAVNAESGWAQPPQPVNGAPSVFTGQLTKSTVGGNVQNSIVFSYSNGSQSFTSPQLPVTITPVSANS